MQRIRHTLAANGRLASRPRRRRDKWPPVNSPLAPLGVAEPVDTRRRARTNIVIYSGAARGAPAAGRKLRKRPLHHERRHCTISGPELVGVAGAVIDRASGRPAQPTNQPTNQQVSSVVEAARGECAGPGASCAGPASGREQRATRRSPASSRPRATLSSIAIKILAG